VSQAGFDGGSDLSLRESRPGSENPIFREVPTLSLWDGLMAMRLKL
jgi:hypothetical protein